MGFEVFRLSQGISINYRRVALLDVFKLKFVFFSCRTRALHVVASVSEGFNFFFES